LDAYDVLARLSHSTVDRSLLIQGYNHQKSQGLLATQQVALWRAMVTAHLSSFIDLSLALAETRKDERPPSTAELLEIWTREVDRLLALQFPAATTTIIASSSSQQSK
jgi:hypothetical protein